MGIELDYLDKDFIHQLDLIIERIILHPNITRAKEKELRILLDLLHTVKYPFHELQKILLEFEEGLS